MDVLVREVPEQIVITEQRMVDQAALEAWLPGAMSRVLKAAGDAAAGTVDQPYLQRDRVANEPVFIVIYEGNPNDYLGQLTWTQEATGRLLAHADRCGGVAGQRFVIFHGLVSADSDGPVEVCVPVTHQPDDPAELAWRVEPAHHEAFIQVTKVHFEVPAIFSVYDQLAQWVCAPARKQTGSPREVYVPGIEPLFAAVDTHICDVAIPFVTPNACGRRG